MKWDIMDLYLPWKNYITETLNNHELPLWDPFINSGFAQMSDPGTWYPVSWIIGFLMRYDVTAVHIEYLLHLYIAGIGFYKVAEYFSFSRKTRLILSSAFMLAGFFISNAQHLGWLVGTAWFTWSLYFFLGSLSNPNKTTAIKLGLTLFLMLSGGYAGIFIVSGYVLFGFFVYNMFLLLAKKQYIIIRKWLG